MPVDHVTLHVSYNFSVWESKGVCWFKEDYALPLFGDVVLSHYYVFNVGNVMPSFFNQPRCCRGKKQQAWFSLQYLTLLVQRNNKLGSMPQFSSKILTFSLNCSFISMSKGESINSNTTLSLCIFTLYCNGLFKVIVQQTKQLINDAAVDKDGMKLHCWLRIP